MRFTRPAIAIVLLVASFVVAKGTDAQPSPSDDEASDHGLPVRLEDAPDVLPATYLRLADEVVLTMRLGQRLVRAHVEARELDHAQSGNGAFFDIDFVWVRGGVLVVTHHSLDRVVDPPRFEASRWSEGWWFPADMQSGERAIALGDLGEQYVHAAGQDDGTICISDAVGHVQRREVVGRTLVRARRSAPCPRVRAEQPERVFHVAAGQWATDDEYLRIHGVVPLRSGMEALQVFWSDGGQYEEGEDVPEHRSTRLVSPDADPEGRIHWYYLDPTGYCAARISGDVITCGRHRYRLTSDGLVVLQ